MTELYHSGEPKRMYWDRRFHATPEDQIAALKGAFTVYVGNLDFKTTEQQIYDTFSRAGPIQRIIMGLNKETKEPCGFCFIEYFTSEHAGICLKFLDQTTCDGRIIRCELDSGFKPGREYGRGKSGGQIRDDKKAFLAAAAASIGEKRRRVSYGDSQKGYDPLMQGLFYSREHQKKTYDSNLENDPEKIIYTENFLTEETSNLNEDEDTESFRSKKRKIDPEVNEANE